ncbi:unnamed protein product, partial [Ectocarpus fasciculatus]
EPRAQLRRALVRILGDALLLLRRCCCPRRRRAPVLGPAGAVRARGAGDEVAVLRAGPGGRRQGCLRRPPAGAGGVSLGRGGGGRGRGGAPRGPRPPRTDGPPRAVPEGGER